MSSSGAQPAAPPPAAETAPSELAEPRPALTDESGEHEAASRLLSRGAIRALSARLPAEQRERWRLLFNSTMHGQSFNRFLKHVLDKGPTIVAVRDTAGHAFGGYAPEAWKLGPKFCGGYSCFLFSLAPELKIHAASGANRNFQYVNDGMEALPNGVAFGGQHGHFGLWLHAGLDEGESSGVCSSFESPLFDAHTKFAVESVEVWATCVPTERPSGDGAEAGEGGTVMQRKKVDKDFVAMASNRTFASDNL
ncbi:hypothetical protein KFE25_012226 [Diacronema lutheri]|uniref:MTOR-associated protein MEAK7 n=1 Tax=Diacronema lutheri TaxID=2081491 RepID=A0A8J5XBH3_DIALT|nr:hypothetical protein KFE25_012226 [Diacronema lutheri]